MKWGKIEQLLCIVLCKTNATMRAEKIRPALRSAHDAQRYYAVILVQRFPMVEEHRKIHLRVVLRASMYPVFSKDLENTGFRGITAIASDTIKFIYDTTVFNREYNLVG